MEPFVRAAFERGAEIGDTFHPHQVMNVWNEQIRCAWRFQTG